MTVTDDRMQQQNHAASQDVVCQRRNPLCLTTLLLKGVSTNIEQGHCCLAALVGVAKTVRLEEEEEEEDQEGPHCTIKERSIILNILVHTDRSRNIPPREIFWIQCDDRAPPRGPSGKKGGGGVGIGISIPANKIVYWSRGPEYVYPELRCSSNMCTE